MMDKNSTIYVAGHLGMVGSAIFRALNAVGYNNLITRTRQQLDLRRQADVEAFFREEKPEYVFLAAAKVGGIVANMTGQADFLLDNLIIQTNIIKASLDSGVKRLLFLGSSCIYPRDCSQPIREEHLLSAPLEPTNEGYAIAKIVGLKACQFLNTQYGTKYLSVMPCNVYGPHDNYNPQTSHVLASLIKKFHDAKVLGQKSVSVWGSGRQQREFIYADDLAEACLFLMDNYYENTHVNVGAGNDVSINELAHLIKDVVGFGGDIVFDTTKPEGMMRKLMDCSRLFTMGWTPKTTLQDGLEKAYAWFLENHGGNVS